MDFSLYEDKEIAGIYDRQFKAVYRVCFSFMKNEEDAEDMVQETFLKLIASKKQFESEEHERAWLIVTASNTCKDELRRWKRRLENIRNLLEQETVENDVLTEPDRKGDGEVLTWVMKLPLKYKQVIYLYYYEGYRTLEIADMLHCPESTVRSRLLRGRKLLKKNSVYHANPAIVLTAALAGSFFVAATAYAAYVYRLHDLHLGKEYVLDLSGRYELPEEILEKDIPVKETDIISLGGIAGSPEYMACREWQEFLTAYDTDGSLLADKADEICEKYGLSKLEGFYLADDYDDLRKRTGIGDVCKNVRGTVRWDILESYLYADGTFFMDGRVSWKDAELYVTDFQMERTRKGYFNPVTLNIGRIEEYHEWNYTTESGQEVLLANSSEKALIIVEREDSFIVVNVLGASPADGFDVSDEMLEGLATLFNFSAVL